MNRRLFVLPISVILLLLPALLSVVSVIQGSQLPDPRVMTMSTKKNVVVQVSSNFFSPASVTINVGDTVTWTRLEGLHNVKADDGSFRLGEPPNGDPGSGWTTA